MESFRLGFVFGQFETLERLQVSQDFFQRLGLTHQFIQKLAEILPVIHIGDALLQQPLERQQGLYLWNLMSNRIGFEGFDRVNLQIDAHILFIDRIHVIGHG